MVDAFGLGFHLFATALGLGHHRFSGLPCLDQGLFGGRGRFGDLGARRPDMDLTSAARIAAVYDTQAFFATLEKELLRLELSKGRAPRDE